MMKGRITAATILAGLLATATLFATTFFMATAQVPQEHELVISAQDTSGTELPGMWLSIRMANGTYIGSGYTPLTFPGTSGESYSIKVADYDGLEFTKWEDGSTDSTRTVTLGAGSNGTEIIAEYDPGDSMRGLTPLTFPGAEGGPSLTVEAMEGNQTLSLWTFIDPQPGNDTSGSATYTVYAGNFENHVFDQWSDGNPDRVRTLTVGQNTTITAQYKPGESAIVIPQGATNPAEPSYDPEELSVQKGTTIVVSNADFAPHSVTAGTGPEDAAAGNAFETGLMFPGDYAHIETGNLDAKEYPYYCFVHPYMTGNLTVTE
jgi:plastocyanin